MKIFRVVYQIDNMDEKVWTLIQDEFFEAENEYVALRKFKEQCTIPSENLMTWAVEEVDELPKNRNITL